MAGDTRRTAVPIDTFLLNRVFFQCKNRIGIVRCASICDLCNPHAFLYCVPWVFGVEDIVSVLADPPEEMQLESGFNFLVAEASTAHGGVCIVFSPLFHCAC